MGSCCCCRGERQRSLFWSMKNSGGRSCVMLRVAPKTLVQGTFLNARPADFANASASRRRPPARYESVRSRRLAQATGASTAASAPVSTSRDPTALLDVPCPARAEKRRQAAHGQCDPGPSDSYGPAMISVDEAHEEHPQAGANSHPRSSGRGVRAATRDRDSGEGPLGLRAGTRTRMGAWRGLRTQEPEQAACLRRCR